MFELGPASRPRNQAIVSKPSNWPISLKRRQATRRLETSSTIKSGWKWSRLVNDFKFWTQMTDFKFWTLVRNLKLWPQMAILGFGHSGLFWI